MAGLSDFGVRDFGNVLEEAGECRSGCALFDFSFMSCARISGPGSRECIEGLQSRPVTGMQPGEIRYGVCVDGTRAVRSDVTVWCMESDSYEVYSGLRADIERAVSMASASTGVMDRSCETFVFSVQGPTALRSLGEFGDTTDLGRLPYFRHREISLAGVACRIGRLGYTGERGFEIVVTGDAEADALYTALAGKIRPAGLDAADILRTEAGYLLFCNDCRLGCNSHELGLGRFDAELPVRRRYRRVFFHSDRLALDSPYSAPQAVASPASGQILVTSASPSVVYGGTVGMGLVLASDPPATRFGAGVLGIEPVRIVRNRPLFDPDKRIARGGW